MTAFEVGADGYTPAATSPEAAARAPIVDVTQLCSICGEPVEGKSRGPGSIAWKIGIHKRNVHGVAGAAKRKRGAPSAERVEAHPVASIASEMASEITSKVGAPKTDELAAALARGFGLTNYLAASFAVESDKWIKPEYRDSTIAELTLPEDDLRAIMQPIAKLAAGTSVNAKYGRTVVEHVDMIGALGALGQVGMRWATYIRGRREAAAAYAAAYNGQQQHPAPLAAVPDFVPEPGTVYAPSLAQPMGPDYGTDYAAAVAAQDSMTGHVMTAEDVQRMRGA